jgi:hypothetical protein
LQFGVRLERAELLAPVGLHLIKPRLQGDEWLSPELKNADARVIGQALVLDEPVLEQDAKVATHRRGRGAGPFRQPAGSLRTFGEQLDHPTARPVSQHFEANL